MSQKREVETILEAVLEVARQAHELLQKADPDPSAMEQLTEKRASLFLRLQRVVSELGSDWSQDSYLRSLYTQLQEVDQACRELASLQSKRAQSNLQELQRQNNASRAYLAGGATPATGFYINKRQG